MKKKTIQLNLIATGLLLIFLTYFFYPSVNKTTVKNKSEKKDENIISNEDVSKNLFEKVEYKGIYNIDKSFTIKSETAYISAEDAAVVRMSTMHAILDMGDGRVINITSDGGSYNKETYDCFFKGNVKATDSETIIFSDNLDLLSSSDTAAIYNDVVITGNNNSIKADRIDYNFNTNFYHVSMYKNKYSNQKVKIKLTQ
jgi:lipopolysaccharide export system protein LptA